MTHVIILITMYCHHDCLPVCDGLPIFSSPDGKHSIVRTMISWPPAQHLVQQAQDIPINKMINPNIHILFVGKLKPRESKEFCPSSHSEFELGSEPQSPDFGGFLSTFSWLFPIPYFKKSRNTQIQEATRIFSS